MFITTKLKKYFVIFVKFIRSKKNANIRNNKKNYFR